MRAQNANPQFSLRAYAKRLGIHVGALSSILNGKRNVSRKLAERVARRMMLDPQKRSELLGFFPAKRKSKPGLAPAEAKPSSRYLELSAQSFRVIAEWEHFAVLCLFRMRDFRSDPEWMAAKLGISEAKVTATVERLLSLDLVARNAAGKLSRTTQSVRTTDDVADLSLKKCHEQSLDLAKRSLFRDPVHLRDHTSVSMAIDPSKLSMAKELIRKFQDELSDLLESGNPSEVYRLSMQLFPLTGEKK